MYKQASNKGFYSGKDVKLSPGELQKYLSTDLPGYDSINRTYNGKKVFIKNITYLGNPHPLYKKRIQLSKELKKDYEELPGAQIILGHYINKYGDRLYVVFELSGNRIGKSKSTHIYADDLQNGFMSASNFSKIDNMKNVVTVIKPSNLEGTLNSNNLTDDVVRILAKAVMSEKIWKAVDKITEMVERSYRHAQQTEWPGWYLENLAEVTFKDNDAVITGDRNKKIKSWKPDLFTTYPIDLKVHSNDKDDIPGNDFEGVSEAITKYGKIGLFVVEVKANKESDEREVSQWRREKFNKPSIHEKWPKRKLKESVEIILIKYGDIDSEALGKLGKFNQGKNSNGKPRKPKLMYKSPLLNKIF